MPKILKIKNRNYTPYGEEVYAVLKKMIIKGYFQPAQKLTENELSHKLGVSRTPIREAIRRLATEGLVDILPRTGARISELTIKDVNEIYEIRDVLECFAAQKATSTITDKEIEALTKLLKESKRAFSKNDILKMAQVNDKFHNIIYRPVKNVRLAKLIDILRTNIRRYRELKVGNPSEGKESIRGHAEILNGLRRRDRKAVKRAVHKHILQAREILFTKIQR